MSKYFSSVHVHGTYGLSFRIALTNIHAGRGRGPLRKARWGRRTPSAEQFIFNLSGEQAFSARSVLLSLRLTKKRMISSWREWSLMGAISKDILTLPRFKRTEEDATRGRGRRTRHLLIIWERRGHGMPSSIGIVGGSEEVGRTSESLISQFTRSIVARLGLDADYRGIIAFAPVALTEQQMDGERTKVRGKDEH